MSPVEGPLPYQEGGADDIEKFRRLTAEWKSQAEFLASPTAIADLSAYRAIIAMGSTAVPFILGELRRDPDHWFVALKTDHRRGSRTAGRAGRHRPDG
jgi:hypothetical protein